MPRTVALPWDQRPPGTEPAHHRALLRILTIGSSLVPLRSGPGPHIWLSLCLCTTQLPVVWGSRRGGRSHVTPDLEICGLTTPAHTSRAPEAHRPQETPAARQGFLQGHTSKGEGGRRKLLSFSHSLFPWHWAFFLARTTLRRARSPCCPWSGTGY